MGFGDLRKILEESGVIESSSEAFWADREYVGYRRSRRRLCQGMASRIVEFLIVVGEGFRFGGRFLLFLFWHG